MLNLPESILTVMAMFSPLFFQPTYLKAVHLITGHILSRGNSTITNCLRCAGLSNDSKYSKYHDVFRRAKWSSLEAGGILLLQTVKTFLPNNVVEIVVDTTLERRRGPYIFGLGKHRDAVLSTSKKKVFSIGHNWLVASILIRFPGTRTKWALPFLSVLLRPEHALSASKNPADFNQKRRHKKLTKWTAQITLQVRRWLGSEHKIVLIADSAFCCRLICRACRKANVQFCTQLRLDARLFDFPDPKPYRLGRPRLVGKRLANMDQLAIDPETKWEKLEVEWYGGATKVLDVVSGKALWYGYGEPPESILWVLTRDPDNGNELVGLMFTNPNASAKMVIEHFVGRWNIETTFQEVREHLKYETLRTWADKGIEKVSPAVMASYSIVVLIASKASEAEKDSLKPYQSAWYPKNHVTFSDLHAYVKMLIINEQLFQGSAKRTTLRKGALENFLYRMAVG